MEGLPGRGKGPWQALGGGGFAHNLGEKPFGPTGGGGTTGGRSGSRSGGLRLSSWPMSSAKDPGLLQLLGSAPSQGCLVPTTSQGAHVTLSTFIQLGAWSLHHPWVPVSRLGT